MENQKQMALPVTLKGNNYLLWSRTTKTVLRSRGLWEHVFSQEPAKVRTEAREGEEPLEKSEEDSKWDKEDQLVLAVLQSSLEPAILAAYSYAETAKDLWDTLLGVYGNLSNVSRIFEVKRALNNLQQEEKSFKDVFGDFRGLWAELEMIRPPTTDLKEMEERREQDQVFGLLLALNGSFKNLIEHILRYEKLPTLNEVCMMIQKEEGSRGLFQGPSETAHLSKGTFRPMERRDVVCEHCKMKGHFKERCWTLYPNLKPARLRGNAHFTKEGGNFGNDVVRKSDLEALIKSISKLSESGKCFLTPRISKPLVIDSGATHNMISDRELLSNVRPHPGKVSIANGTEIEIKGIGELEVLDSRSSALFMPDFSSNLLSVSRTTKDLDCVAVFGSNEMRFQDNKSGKVIGKGEFKEGLYMLSEASINKEKKFAANATKSQVDWHARFGHPHFKTLQQVMPSVLPRQEECEACIFGKHSRNVFPESSSMYEEVFGLIHSDVWTAPCLSRDQYKYFVSFIDEKSKYSWVTLMSTKSQVFDAFTRFYEYVSTQFGQKIKILRSDNGGEYMSERFKTFIGNHGIVHQTSCAYTPQQNGVSERKNRHLMEIARTIMFGKGVPKSYWGDAVVTACYLINRLPTKNLGYKSPYEVLNHTKPSTEHLRVFGCVCYVHIPEASRNKLEPKSTRCMFLGYSSTQKGYKCYNPDTRRIYVSRDVKFNENVGFFDEKDWNKLTDLVSSQDQAAALRFVLNGLNELITDRGEQGEEADREGERNLETETQDHVQEPQDEEESGKHLEIQEDVSLSNLDTQPTQEEQVEGNPSVAEPTLRRSNRIKYAPEHWKETRVYYNHMASHQQGRSYSGTTPIEVGECSGRTAGLDPVPIGDSISLPQNRSGTLQTITYPIEAFCSLAHLSSKHQVFLGELDKEKIPDTYEEACEDPRWVKAMNEEIESMEKNETWETTSLPKGKKLVGCRWVFTIKYKSTGEIERYKARLVAKGFTQVYGKDYKETFAPVAKLHSVRVLLSVAVNLEWDLFQMDVKNAFLQGDLEEEVYMAAPPGYSDAYEGNQICKLKKAIYGLKQSPRAWYQKLSGCLLGQGFQRSEADHSLFTNRGNQGVVIVLIYVDDIIITGDDDEGIKRTKILLKGAFDIKDLGELKYFLGIEMVRSKEGMFISQRKYTLDLLRETGKLAAKPASTPIEDSYKDDSEEELWPDIKQYQRLVGKLIYLTITRPDICFAVSQISKHMQAPTKHHWGMAERILRYLKSNPGKGIWMGCNKDVELIGYCDSDWAGDRTDRKSTTGYCTFIGGNLVTWRSKKQNVVSLSSAEAEYRAMKDVTKELIWLRYILEDLGVFKEKPTTLYCDNMAAIHISSNPMFHERTKHIERDCHFVREKVLKGIIQPLFVKSGEQCADIFTKAATTQVCDYLHGKIGLMDIHQPTLRGNVENHTQRETPDLGIVEIDGLSTHHESHVSSIGEEHAVAVPPSGFLTASRCTEGVTLCASDSGSLWRALDRHQMHQKTSPRCSALHAVAVPPSGFLTATGCTESQTLHLVSRPSGDLDKLKPNSLLTELCKLMCGLSKWKHG